MSVGKSILEGSVVSRNAAPRMPVNSTVVLKGKMNGKSAMIGLDEDLLSKQMLLVGGTGCGKSTLFYHMIRQLKDKMTDDDVMIIFDTKGDFYSRFFDSSRDYVIGNSSQYYEESERWNIFKEIVADGWEDKQVILNVQEICKAFFEERVKKSNNIFFPNAARDLLAAILVTIVCLGADSKEFVRKIFYNDRFKEYLDSSSGEKLCELLEGYPDMRSVLSYIKGNNQQSQGVLAEMYSVVRDIFIGVFNEKGGFSLRNFVRQKGGRTLFIEYDLSIGNVLAPVYKIMFDLALKEALGQTKNRGNVYVSCDEFKLIPNLQHIEDGVNFGRSLGVKIFAGLQSIEQLYETYGISRGKNLAAGFSSIIAFRANDVTTRNYISNLYGKNMVLEQYQKMNGEWEEERRMGNTVEDWDLNSLKVGEAIVGLPFEQPFRFYFEKYSGQY